MMGTQFNEPVRRTCRNCDPRARDKRDSPTATAVGLFAAIPATIAYNKLSSDAGTLGLRMEGFADEFSAILSRQIDEKVAQRA